MCGTMSTLCYANIFVLTIFLKTWINLERVKQLIVVTLYWCNNICPLLYVTQRQMLISNAVGVSRPGVPGPTSEMSPRAPAQMGRRETEREGGEKAAEEREREVEIPRPSCLSRAQVGCACSRGLQASTREGERAASRERL
jgi:hypothetical protein